MTNPRTNMLLLHKNPLPARAIHDSYAMLELNPNATSADIHSSYRRLAVLNHPDKVSPELREAAEVKFAKLSQAKQTLLDHLELQAFDMNRFTELLILNLKKVNFISRATRNFVRKQMVSITEMGNDLGEALEAVKLTSLQSSITMQTLAQSTIPGLDESIRACHAGFKKAKNDSSVSFAIANYPEVEHLICLHHEANKVEFDWLVKLSHLKMESLALLVSAFIEAKLPLRETCLAFADIENNHERIFEFTAGIHHLSEKKLASFENIEALYQAGLDAQRLSNCLIGLNAINLLTPANRDAIVSAGKSSYRIGRGMETIMYAIPYARLSQKLLNQSMFDRLVNMGNLALKMCYGIVGLIQLLKNHEIGNDIDGLIDLLAENARFSCLTLTESIFGPMEQYGYKEIFFEMRCNQAKYHVQYSLSSAIQAIEIAHLSEMILTEMDNYDPLHQPVTEAIWNNIIDRAQKLVANEPALRTTKTFSAMLDEPLEDGDTLTAKLAHTQIRYVINLAIECMKAKLNIKNALLAASVLPENRFEQLIAHLKKLPQPDSPLTTLSLFQQSSQDNLLYFESKLRQLSIDIENPAVLQKHIGR